MAESGSRAQADKKAAETRTAEVADETAENRARLEAKSAADVSTSGDVPAESASLNPYPDYDLLSLDDLRSLAGERDVEINRDVEKAVLVHELRQVGRGDEPGDTSTAPRVESPDTQPNYDMMRLEDVRSEAKRQKVSLPKTVERAHLVTELRAADTRS